MKKHLLIFLILLVILFTGLNSMAQLPVVTVRFANPQYNCATQTYCLDVEFKSNTPDKQLYGMNVRFFYDDVILEYESMGNFVAGYTNVSPYPPIITTSGPTSGALLFGFPENHPFEFFNGAIQLTGTSSLMLSTTDWTRIFTICFHVDDPASTNVAAFCPSIVWDLEYNPANGGWLAGDDGIVMTVVAPPPAFSSETAEADVHYNWQFDATPEDRPYGNPVNITCISTQGILATATATNATCYGGNNGTATAIPTTGVGPFSYLWSNGATTATATGLIAGTYTVTITDVNICDAITSAVVGQPAVLAAGTAGSNQAICANSAPLELSATPPTGETGAYNYLWQSSVNGTVWNDIPGATNLTYQPGPLSVTTWFQVRQSSVNCPSSVNTNPVIITVVQPIIASVNPDQYLCNQYTTVLSGTWSQPGNSGAWSFVSGPTNPSFGPANNPFVIVSGMIGSPVPYIFRYTLTTNAFGVSCISQADAYVYNYAYPSAAYAGVDQHVCLSTGVSTSTTLNGSIPTSGQGTWSQYNGPTTAVFANQHNPSSTVSNLTEGSYTFFWRIGNGVCDSTYDAVVINVHTPATVAVENDALVCKTEADYQVTGIATNHTGMLWTTSGTGTFSNISNPNPRYTFSPADILAGSVTLTLTAFSHDPCEDVSASMVLTIQPGPVANAGSDATICETSTNYICNATASNYISFYWETLGTGIFNDIHILDPVYIPSQADIDAGCVCLVLHVQGVPPCGEVTDTVRLCISRVPIANAGPDDMICNGPTYLLSQATAENAGYITWHTSGTGTFNNPHAVQPLYNLSAADIASGSVTLTMTILGMSPCPNAADEMVLTIHPAPSVTANVISNVSCYGLADGSIVAVATSGTPPYSYLWSNGQTTATATGLIAGTYAVTVTDSFGCTDATSATVTQPVQLWLSGIIFDALCYGSSDGEVFTMVFGGTTPYTYLWSNGSTNENLTGVTAGNYTLTLTDANSCQTSEIFTIGQPTPVAATGIVIDATCFGGSNGAVEVVATGGTAPYEYLWSTAHTTSSISGLIAGAYTVTITDAHTCELIQIYTVNEPSAQSVTGSIADASCFGGNNGSIDITNNGGTPPYGYEWSNGQTTQDIENLIAGSYTVTITDANSCDLSQTWSVGQPNLLVLDATVKPILCYNYTDGEINLTATGGTAPYTYLWSNGETTEDITNLAAGTYGVTVTDSHLCTAVGAWTINAPPFWAIDITGPQTVCANSTGNEYCAVINDPSHPGDLYSYQWVVTGGFIITGQNSSCIVVTWPPCLNGTVTLVVTRLSDGCILSKTIDVTVIPAPAPIISGPIQVESETSGVQYCTPFIAGHLYSWSVVGGAVVAGQGTNCITIDWGPSPACGCGQITVSETYNGCTGTYTLPITIYPGSNVSIAGYVKYANEQSTHMNGVSVELRDSAGYIVGNTISMNNPADGTPGYYAFTSLDAGTYRIRGSYNGIWGGNNATDALVIQMNVLGTYPLDFIRDSVANVNGSVAPRISALDALYVNLRTVGSISSYPAGDWKVTDTTVAFAGSALSLDLTALCVGDVNGSHIPEGTKQAPMLSIIEDDVMAVRVNEPFNYEVRSNTAASLGAMTLFMGYDKTRFEVVSVASNLEDLKYTINDGQVAIAWADARPFEVKAHETVFSMELKAKQQITEPEAIFDLKAGSEFADVIATPFTNFDLKMASVITPEGLDDITLYNYPNPFKNTTTIVYTLPSSGHVKLVLTNLYGEVIRTLTNQEMIMGKHSLVVDPAALNMPAGVYFYKIIFDGETGSHTKVNKMVFTR